VALPSVPEWAEPCWHLFVVRSRRRDALREHLRRYGVETLVHYPVPPHRQGAYRRLRFVGASLTIAEETSREVLSLPMGPHLSAWEVDRVVEAVLAFDPFAPGETGA
jgi:dTDP-4-amino-4,6-dideoxygalactose transaminase